MLAAVFFLWGGGGGGVGVKEGSSKRKTVESYTMKSFIKCNLCQTLRL